ncbi:PREDICTED: IST1 homolog [Ceratosolen solmsi marchali]|uniref:IST1 homolog n=1 Tax=Ceratosolen solmsi marchali TaxID=326594 RepID=A0AAJ6YIQ3_9HYME|nr:PREDICTED: IST1 homolog [Ceratosolen solmsi marchali]
MPLSGANYTKLKTHLKLAINRFKLLEKKKTELAQKARKEIADYIAAGKVERAKIRVEHIIREDYMIEAFELLEMFCDRLVTRLGLIELKNGFEEDVLEAITTIIWAAPHLQNDVQELKVISDLLALKYGKKFVEECLEGRAIPFSQKTKHKLSVQSPSKLLVEKYLIEIAKIYNIRYEADPQVMAGGQDVSLIDIGNTGQTPNNLDQASGGVPQPPGFIGFPQLPMPPNNNANSCDKPIGFTVPSSFSLLDKDDNNQFNPAKFSYNIPLDKSNINNSKENLPSSYGSLPPDLNKQSDEHPKPQPRSKIQMNDFNLPDLPPVPSDNERKDEAEEIDFDDLMMRFENLKKWD